MRNRFFISLMLAPGPMDAAHARTDAVIESAIQTALERLQSGVMLTEQSSDGITDIGARPLRTWKSVSGHYCREYEVRVTDKGTRIPTITTGSRCRGADGIWREVEDK